MKTNVSPGHLWPPTTSTARHALGGIIFGMALLFASGEEECIWQALIALALFIVAGIIFNH